MKKYLSFFRLRFSVGLQYRVAAIAGLITQFAWGFLRILAFDAFYQSDSTAYPMSFQASSNYIWLQQAFLTMFMCWMLENEILESITNGNIAYEICRPVGIYGMWFSRTAANRLSRAVLRCFPVLIVAMFVPAPYGLSFPASSAYLFYFLITMIIGFLVVVAFTVVIYMVCFFTISPLGIRIVVAALAEFLQGQLIPLPFFPDGFRQLAELSPFAAMQNVPFRVYSGDISGNQIYYSILLQVFWLLALILIGELLGKMAAKKVVVQGG